MDRRTMGVITMSDPTAMRRRSTAIVVVGIGILLVFAALSRPRDGQAELNAMLIRDVTKDTQRVQELVTRGADVNSRDAMGMTPLMWAVYKGRQTTVVYLLENGADIHTKNNDGYTALMLAHARAKSGDARLLRDHARKTGSTR